MKEKEIKQAARLLAIRDALMAITIGGDDVELVFGLKNGVQYELVMPCEQAHQIRSAICSVLFKALRELGIEDGD